MTGLRILSAVLFGGVLLAVILFAPPAWTSVLIAAVILAAAWEWSAFLRLTAPVPRLLYVVVTALLLWFAWRHARDPVVLHAVLAIAALWWVVALGWIAFAPHAVSAVTAALAGWLTLVPAGVALAGLRANPTQGVRWLLFTLFLVWAADTGAYFAGRQFGRHKLAPQVSPGKTWEGAAGGLLLAAALAAAAASGFGRSVFSFTLLALLVAFFSIVGDLSESMFKRYASLKDSGRLIPGHGGILDRIDSLTAAAPLLLLGSSLLDAVPR